MHSPIRAASLARAAVEAVRNDESPLRELRRALADRFAVRDVVLTDSGTSALILALRLTRGPHARVALPAFSCVDLASAVRYADVGVRLYDLDPATLGPDLASLERVLAGGVDAVVMAHLYGMPVDGAAVRAMAARYGVPVIDDAAQGAGARFNGRPVGSGGALGVLSFGRGKGVTGGGGGALLIVEDAVDGPAGSLSSLGARAAHGFADVARTAAQWALGRPEVYALPSMIPWLRLGEMVYHPAHEPQSISSASAALATRALSEMERELAMRRRNARRLLDVLADVKDACGILPVPGAQPGYLRLPVLDRAGRAEQPSAGVVRSYPRAMHEQDELRPALRGPVGPLPGATELARSLFTLPTHSLLTEADLAALTGWFASPASSIMRQALATVG